MFKLQYFRATEPSAAADSSPSVGAFDYTGAPRHQTAIWESILNWMQGSTPVALHDPTSAAVDSAAALLSDLLDSPALGIDYRTEEPKRLGAACKTYRQSALPVTHGSF